MIRRVPTVPATGFRVPKRYDWSKVLATLTFLQVIRTVEHGKTSSEVTVCLTLYESIDKKLKWSRYRPGVAQRVGRGIALLFHDRGTGRWWVVSNTPWPHFTPGKEPVPILQEAGWAPGPDWTGEKSRPHRDSIPDRPACSQSLYRLNESIDIVKNINGANCTGANISAHVCVLGRSSLQNYLCRTGKWLLQGGPCDEEPNKRCIIPSFMKGETIEWNSLYPWRPCRMLRGCDRNMSLQQSRVLWKRGFYLCHTRAVRKTSSHFEYLENLSRDFDITWQPVRGDLTLHSWTITLPWG